MTLDERLRGFLALTRPGNAVAAGVLTFTGAFVAGATLHSLFAVAAAIGATVFAVGAGNSINDYFDHEIDAINRPDRPIPSGAISLGEALWFSVSLFVAAMVCAAFLPTLAIAIAAVNLAALVAYTKLFKGLPGAGNVVVAYLTGSTLLFGAAAVYGGPAPDLPGPFSPSVIVLSVLAAVATLTREIVKDVEDLAGDREEGLRTLPIVIGERRALGVALAALTVAILASPVPYVEGQFGAIYLALLVPADAVMLRAAIGAFRDPGRSQRRLKVGMFLAAAAFIVGRAAAIVGPIW